MSYLNTHDDTIPAGQPKRIGLPGLKFCLMESAARLSLRFIDHTGQTVGEARGVLDGIEIALPREFTYIEFSSDVDQAVKVAVASGEIQFNRVSGSVEASIAQAATVTNDAAIAISAAAPTLVYAADTSHRGYVVHNPATNTGKMYLLGSAAGTAANAARILSPGDTWAEDNAAAAALYVIADVDGEFLRRESRR